MTNTSRRDPGRAPAQKPPYAGPARALEPCAGRFISYACEWGGQEAGGQDRSSVGLPATLPPPRSPCACPCHGHRRPAEERKRKKDLRGALASKSHRRPAEAAPPRSALRGHRGSPPCHETGEARTRGRYCGLWCSVRLMVVPLLQCRLARSGPQDCPSMRCASVGGKLRAGPGAERVRRRTASERHARAAAAAHSPLKGWWPSLSQQSRGPHGGAHRRVALASVLSGRLSSAGETEMSLHGVNGKGYECGALASAGSRRPALPEASEVEALLACTAAKLCPAPRPGRHSLLRCVPPSTPHPLKRTSACSPTAVRLYGCTAVRL
jgi:hypothetical protein